MAEDGSRTPGSWHVGTWSLVCPRSRARWLGPGAATLFQSSCTPPDVDMLEAIPRKLAVPLCIQASS